jgi:hypothetical protein
MFNPVAAPGFGDLGRSLPEYSASEEDRSATITDAIALLHQAQDALAERLVAKCDLLMAEAGELLIPGQA